MDERPTEGNTLIQKGNDNPITENSYEESNLLGSKEVVEKNRTGTVITSIFTIATSAVGAGVLGFPFAFKSSGLTLGIIFTIVIFLLTILSSHIVAECGLKANVSTYQDLIKVRLGPKMGFLSELVLTVFHIGACIGYMTVIGDVISPVIRHFLPGFWFLDRKVIVIIFSTVFIFPVILFKSIKFLGYLGFLAIMATVYTTLFIITYGIYDILIEEPVGLRKDIDIIINPSFQLLYAFPLIGFAFNCAQTIPAISAELKNPSILKMDIIIIVGLTIVLILEIMVGIMGYLSFGSTTEGNILVNFTDITFIPAIIARVFMAFVVTFAYPIVNFTGRLVMKTLFFKKIAFNDVAYYLITISWFIGTLLASLFVPGLEFVFAITGSVGVVIMMFVFPAILLIQMSKEYESKVLKYLSLFVAVIMFIFGIAVSISGTTVAMVEFFAGKDWYLRLEFWRNQK